MISKNVILILLVAILGMSMLSTATYLSDVFGKGINLDENDYATNFVVRFVTHEGHEYTFYTFSKIGFVRSNEIKFQLESIPSKDKGPYYDFISKSMESSETTRFDVAIDLMAADGYIIETLNYKKCMVESYFVHVNDSKGKFSFLEGENSKLEIREITKFACFRFTIDV